MSAKVILLVEDEPLLRKLVQHTFRNSDYEVLEALDGEEAVALAKREKPDLILMDIQLPKISGYEATRRIKELPGLGAIPIIALTGFTLLAEEGKARDVGCEEFISKPFQPDFLLETVRRFLERPASTD